MRQLRLPRIPRQRKPNEYELWQLAGDKENEILDTLEREYEDDLDLDIDQMYTDLDTAHAATVAAFAPLAPRVKGWWVK